MVKTMPIMDNWRVLIIICLILNGVWGLMAKIASNHLNSYTVPFIAITTAWLTIAMLSFSKLSWQSNIGISIAAGCGILGGLSTIVFYAVLKQIPANIAIPISSLYILITVVLSYLFLGETLSIRQLIGIILGCIAVILITS